jgi:hypothetical protein
MGPRRQLFVQVQQPTLQKWSQTAYIWDNMLHRKNGRMAGRT